MECHQKSVRCGSTRNQTSPATTAARGAFATRLPLGNFLEGQHVQSLRRSSANGTRETRPERGEGEQHLPHSMEPVLGEALATEDVLARLFVWDARTRRKGKEAKSVSNK